MSEIIETLYEMEGVSKVVQHSPTFNINYIEMFLCKFLPEEYYLNKRGFLLISRLTLEKRQP